MVTENIVVTSIQNQNANGIKSSGKMYKIVLPGPLSTATVVKATKLKTPIAITRTEKRPLVAMPKALPVMHQVHQMQRDMSATQPKRRRLTHLSPEQKLMRRKMKNREAAQTARDRKKAKLDDLEIRVLELEEENERLRKQNHNLVRQTEVLQIENQKYKESACTISNDKSLIVPSEKGSESMGSAALPALLPKENLIHLLTQLVTLMPFVNCLMTLSLIHCLNCSMKSPRQMYKENVPQAKALLKATREPSIPQWWGPHQKNWSPSKI